MKNTIHRVEHIWCEENDRWIYIESNERMKIVGINFMQGNDYEYFKSNWCVNNKPLFEFYEFMSNYFKVEKASVDTIGFINKCMWSYHTAVSLSDGSI
jgi:hypothetical protein